ncbi:hypothetical protein HKX48_006377 [Thoreauomyces humboldtii]|nr:hypothetical protein HKX48_006377 [Thoreauomyces humboldtii]
MAKRKVHRAVPITLRTLAPSAASSSSSASSSSKSSRFKPSAGTSKAPTTSSKQTQQIISTYHALNKQLTHLIKTGDVHGAEKVRIQMQDLGGLDGYQKASLKGGDEKKGLGACGTWLVPYLKEERARVEALDDHDHCAVLVEGSAGERRGGKYRLLDVGAVSGQTYRKQGWIDATYIDLNSQAPNVKSQDFFERPAPVVGPEGDAERYHCVCLSLVVNFVPDIEMRGDMLIHARRFLFPSGILFLVLPLPCIKNSRYMTHDHLVAILKSIGFAPVKHHFATKLAFYIVRRIERGTFVHKEWNKVQIHPGIDRNNFAIVVKKK